MSLGDLTRDAVESAMLEFDSVGGEAFLKRYGFAPAKRYSVRWKGNQYPSKAIAGVAHKYVTGQQILNSSNFTGGEQSVVRKLRSLGFDVQGPARNPDWTRDELILALELYLTNPANPPGKASAAVAALSDLLNKMHRITGGTASVTFRNADGVYMKMMNIRAIDPSFLAQGKVGMKAGGSLEKVVWADYEGRRQSLIADAKAIRDAVEQADESKLAKLPPASDYEGEEGGVVIRLHKRYERDPKIIAEKRRVAKLAGSLACEVCAFDFKEVYGDLGDGYIEVHHTKPVHLMGTGSKTKLSDLALLCSNCHRIAHRKRLPLSLDELRAAIKGPKRYR